MLARLKKASRRCAALIWATAFVFALAPVISMAYAAPAGAFARVLLHVHEPDEAGHVHHGHYHDNHAHDQQGGHHHYDDGTDVGSDDDPGQPRLHVHYDACCPSILIPVLSPATFAYRVADPVTAAPVQPMHGAPPDRLLRPPIPLSLL